MNALLTDLHSRMTTSNDPLSCVLSYRQDER